MRFGLIQVALGIALWVLAKLLGGFGWLLVWPAGAVLVVGIAYLRSNPRVFGKRADGRLGPVHAFLLWPYLLVAWSLWQLKSRLQGEHPYDEVSPGIFVGRRPLNPGDVPPGVETVVDLTSEFSRAGALRQVPRFVCLPTLDTAAPDATRLRELLDSLRDHEAPIFIHCAMGHGRSATVAAALMLCRGLSEDVDSTITAMRARRPRIHLHREQREALNPYRALHRAT